MGFDTYYVMKDMTMNWPTFFKSPDQLERHHTRVSHIHRPPGRH